MKLTKHQRKEEKKLRRRQEGDEVLARAHAALQGADTSRFSKQMADHVDQMALEFFLSKRR